jgi:hypothetical protein
MSRPFNGRGFIDSRHSVDRLRPWPRRGGLPRIHLYPNRFANLQVGKVRFGLIEMMREAFSTTERSAVSAEESRYFLTTTTGKCRREAIVSWLALVARARTAVGCDAAKCGPAATRR